MAFDRILRELFREKQIFEKFAIFAVYWPSPILANPRQFSRILCLMVAFPVPAVCTYGVRRYVNLTLLSMEVIPDTQILQKFHK